MVQNRSEIEEKYRWDLESIFRSKKECLDELKELEKETQKLQDFEGKVSESGENLLKVLELKKHISSRLESVRKYAQMKKDEDTRNQDAQELKSKVDSFSTEFGQETSFIRPEIVAIGSEKVRRFREEEEGLEKFNHFFDDLFRVQEHILKPEQERIVSSLGDVSDTAHETYSAFINADLSFPDVEKDSREVELTLSKFTKLQKDQDREFRRNVYEKLYNTFSEYQNTISTTLEKGIRKNVRFAQIKNFKSAREAALKPDKISVEIYDNLVDITNENLDLMERYVELKQEALDLDELMMHDLYMPFVKSKSPEIEYTEAKEHILEALQPLGEKYVKKVREGLEEERWVDLYENEGKRPGAYSSGGYDTKPFILMNYQDDIESMFTLIHEIGHSMHSHFTNQTQPYVYSHYTIFQAEVASTTNEALLTRHLLENVEDKKFRRHVLGHVLENFRATFFRQVMFSEFEHWLHTEIEDGEALTPDKLNGKYRELKQKYYNNAEIDEKIGKEWMRIPHFYYNHYVYQYATGISAGHTLAEKIVSEGPEDYLEFLKTGGSEYSIESLKKAGADLKSGEPIEKALSMFEKRLDELENL